MTFSTNIGFYFWQKKAVTDFIMVILLIGMLRNINVSMFTFGIPSLFFTIFGLFKQTFQFLQQIYVKNVHPWESNPWPSEHKLNCVNKQKIENKLKQLKLVKIIF